ncbi:MAG TPA: glycosyltransferase family 2 protein [Phycisphaerae bacterium]|nr:glycosyltransferase family 2 protein [Phycisphaerae bacterium]HRW55713.1 glycosyltransferase family 2 protein [Phycisphaerae bacterium]
MNKLPSLTIFFPFYNEEDNIERVARLALEAAPKFADDYEIILVNDGSLDRTEAIADRLAEESPHIRAVHNRPNVGYGGAVRRGFAEATKDYVFFTDGDGQFDLNEIDRLVALLDQCDIAVGYRANRADPFMRKVNAWGWRRVIRMFFGVKVRDIDCAFKLLPKTFLDAIELKSEGAMISAELLAKAKYRGLRVAETPVSHFPRTAGAPTGANFKVILKAFRELFRLRRHIRSEGLR